MRNNKKQYYTQHFGRFTPLSFKEINELCAYELYMLHAPEVLYLKQGWTMKSGNTIPGPTERKNWLQKILHHSIN
jgi:hypothetical protein